MRRLLLSLALLLATPMLVRAQQPVLNIYNWADYIDPYAIERFQRETGIRIRYDVYDTLETLEGKLSAGRSGYDIVVPTSEPAFNRLVRAGALRPLDMARIPNAANLDPALMARIAGVDPGNRHGVIYLWGTVGLGMNAARLKCPRRDLICSLPAYAVRASALHNLSQILVATHTRRKPFHSVAPLTGYALGR